MRSFDLFKEAITGPQRGRVLFHIFGFRVRRNVPARDEQVKDFGERNGFGEFSLSHVRGIEKGDDRPFSVRDVSFFSVRDVSFFGVMGKGDRHISCLGPVGHYSTNMVRVLAGTIHLIGNNLGEKAGSFQRFVFRREAEDPFLIIRERGLPLGTGTGATRIMRGSGRCRLSERWLGMVDHMPRGRDRVLILVIRIN